jgi:predicted enzyme related to lactoylglutathione lyase
VDDVEAVVQRIAKDTGEQLRIIDFEELGQRIIQLRDPDGNVIQLFSQPKER